MKYIFIDDDGHETALKLLESLTDLVVLVPDNEVLLISPDEFIHAVEDEVTIGDVDGPQEAIQVARSHYLGTRPVYMRTLPEPSIEELVHIFNARRLEAIEAQESNTWNRVQEFTIQEVRELIPSSPDLII